MFFASANDVFAAVFEVAPETITALFERCWGSYRLPVFVTTKRVCSELRQRPPLSRAMDRRVVRTPEVGYDVIE